MKNLKYCVLGLSLMAVGFFTVGCVDKTDNTQRVEDKPKVFCEYSNEYIRGVSEISIVVDSETGVNYVLFTGPNARAVTPRLNPDGSIYTNK